MDSEVDYTLVSDKVPMNLREVWEKHPFTFVEKYKSLVQDLYLEMGGDPLEVDLDIIYKSSTRALILLSFPFSGKDRLTKEEIYDYTIEIKNKLLMFERTGIMEL